MYAATQSGPTVETPAVAVPSPETSPVQVIKPAELMSIGQNLNSLFTQYVSDRRIAELRWLRNLRQYQGIYDPEIEQQLSPNRSKAYPRMTRVKCVSVLARIMNLMFPGNEKNWTLKASPSAEMTPQDIMEAIQEAMKLQQAAGLDPSAIDEDMVVSVTQRLAEKRAKGLESMVDDQLQEIGGDQTMDYVALIRKVVASGILYGLGVLQGPFVRTQNKVAWGWDPATQQPVAHTKAVYKPQFEFIPVWDFYPDMTAKTLEGMDGYFIRKVMAKSQLRKLADREDFFGDIIKTYLKDTNTGNYKAQPFETDLRSMGVKVNVNEMKHETAKYEVIIWNGVMDGNALACAGVEVPEHLLADDIEAEVWMVGNQVIKADINPWRKLGIDVRTIHTFLFDEDDTSPVGNGLPYIMRDSQMSISAAARMLLDNCSVVCGPNMELNTDLLRPDQDLTSVGAYKLWYREGTGVDAQMPALRNIPIDSHIDELLKTIDLFMRFADMETFVGPATGGDMAQGPSEPMRTAAGASMLRGDAALPFKDIIRNFDRLTQSVITSVVQFNRKFNPDRALEGDYNVIARGATSLVAKEVRGMQIDQLAATLTPDEAMHVDYRKLVEMRFAVRDLDDMLISEDEAQRKQAQMGQQQAEMADMQKRQVESEIRGNLTSAYKNITQGTKNIAAADTSTAKATMDIVEKGAALDEKPAEKAGPSKPAKNSTGGKK